MLSVTTMHHAQELRTYLDACIYWMQRWTLLSQVTPIVHSTCEDESVNVCDEESTRTPHPKPKGGDKPKGARVKSICEKGQLQLLPSKARNGSGGKGRG